MCLDKCALIVEKPAAPGEGGSSGCCSYEGTCPEVEISYTAAQKAYCDESKVNCESKCQGRFVGGAGCSQSLLRQKHSLVFARVVAGRYLGVAIIVVTVTKVS